MIYAVNRQLTKFLKGLKRLMDEIPSLGSEAETFAKDIKAIISSQPNLSGEGQMEKSKRLLSNILMILLNDSEGFLS